MKASFEMTLDDVLKQMIAVVKASPIDKQRVMYICWEIDTLINRYGYHVFGSNYWGREEDYSNEFFIDLLKMLDMEMFHDSDREEIRNVADTLSMGIVEYLSGEDCNKYYGIGAALFGGALPEPDPECWDLLDVEQFHLNVMRVGLIKDLSEKFPDYRFAVELSPANTSQPAW